MTITPDAFSFAEGTYHRSLPPDIHFSSQRPARGVRFAPIPGRSDLYVVGIGDRPASADHSVSLFKPDQLLPRGLTRYDCLELFLRSVFIDIIDRHFFRMRPRVAISGIELFETLLGGYADVVLEHAVLTAGALEVVFE